MIGRIIIISILTITIVYNLSARYTSDVHEYLMEESYDLLKIERQIEYPEINQYFHRLMLGVVNEDKQDWIYHYRQNNPPDFNQFLIIDVINFIGQLFYKGGDPYVSITHFWGAHGGPDNSTFLSDTIPIPNIGSIYYSFYCENALQKARKYIEGPIIPHYQFGNHHFEESGLANLIYFIEVYDLFEFYETGACEVFTVNGSVGTLHLIEAEKLALFYEIIGRICHLMMDMGVPAHAHQDVHYTYPDTTKGDTYEGWSSDGGGGFMFFQKNWYWNSINTYFENKGLFDLSNESDPLLNLMYVTNKVAAFFASDKTNGNTELWDDISVSNANSYLQSLYSDLEDQGIDENHPTRLAGTKTFSECAIIRDNVFPTSMRSVASFLEYIIQEIDLSGNYYSRPTVEVSGFVNLDNGTGNITDVEITFESDEHFFIINPDANGYYSIDLYIDNSGYDVTHSISGYYPVQNNIVIEDLDPIEFEDITLISIDSGIAYVSDDPSNNEAFNDIKSALDHAGNMGGGIVYLLAGTYSGAGNVDLTVPYSNDPQNPYQIEIRGYTGPEDVIIDCENLYGVNYSGFIFDDEGYGTITDGYILRDIIIKNAKPGIDIVNGSPHIYKMTLQNTSPGINILSGSPLISYSTFVDNSIPGSQQYETYGAGIYSEGNPVIENNEFHNCRAKLTQYNPCLSYGGAIALHNSNGALIRKNLFAENRAARGSAISVTESANITISSNEMSENTFSTPSPPPPPPDPENHPESDGLVVYIEAVDSLYFDYNLIYLNGEEVAGNNNVISVINSDNVDFVNNTVMNHNNHIGLHLNNTVSMSIVNTILYGNFENLSVVGNQPDISFSLIGEDPKLTRQYKPRWEATLVSPVIDAGDPDLPWDPDETPPDIGAVRAIEHDFHITTAPLEEPDRYLWRSFPVLDRIYNAGEEVLYVLEPVEEQTNYFKIFDQDGNEVLWQNQQWNLVQFNYFDSVLGYKAESAADFSIPTSGIKQPDNTVVTLDAEVENWRGYFIEETHSIDVALADIWDNLIAVYSEDWAWHASGPTIPPEKATMEYGKMYKIFVEEPCEFVYRTGDHVPPNQRTMTEGFSYSETPMYSVIMIDEIDDPEAVEIGVYQDDVCIGATQIEEEPVQILAFPQDSSRSNLGGNIHFELYYGQRSENKRIRDYTVKNPDGSTGSRLSLVPYRFNYVTLDAEPDEPITQLTTTNYPNPFNPETTISYSLPSDTHVEITIFNIKGQVVRRLVDGEQPAGRYQTVWNGKNDNGRSVGSGVYFYRITTDDKTLREKMLLLK